MPESKSNNPGYKHTSLGWIPEDWEVRLLDSVAKRGSGHTPNKEFDHYYNGGIKWISLADSSKLDNGIICETKIEISDEGIKHSSAVLHPKGTVVLSRDAGVGKSAVMGSNMAVSQHFIAWTCDERLDNWFLYYWMQLKKEFFERQAIGSTIKTIGLPLFKKLQIIYPPVPEQQKISTLLTTWDKAIEKTNQLIAKKEARKKWLMGQLLSGKRRLKGFENQKWVKQSAGDIFKSVSIKGSTDGELLSATQDRGMIPRNMLEGRVTMPTSGTEGFKRVDIGDFVISLRSFQGGLEYSYYNGLVSPAYTVLKPKNEISDDFYKQYFKSHEFIGRLATAVIGIRDGKQISFDDFCLVNIPYPLIKEQTGIANILQTTDKEIQILKTKLDKLKEQKKGLMQVLLTGKKRIKIK